jgi:hypothetical protein
MEIDRNGMEILTRAECLKALRSTPIGRVVVTVGALPAAFPVNFVVVGDDVMFMTGKGTKLQAAVRNAVVAFEADGFDTFGHTGWSVLVQGRAAEESDPVRLAQAHRAGLGAWLPREATSAVRIETELISGRKLSLDGAANYRHQAVEPVDPPWIGHLDGCVVCGSEALLPVSDGDQTHFLCAGCAACWHVELGWVRRVVPGRCAGCAHKEICTAAFLADMARNERLASAGRSS